MAEAGVVGASLHVHIDTIILLHRVDFSHLLVVVALLATVAAERELAVECFPLARVQLHLRLRSTLERRSCVLVISIHAWLRVGIFDIAA